jgi:hypothetical protein
MLHSKSRDFPINGAQFSGTPGPITDVMGTLVCNAVDATQNTPGTSQIANTTGDLLYSSGRFSYEQ